MRGSRKRGVFRRRLAGFLAACLVVTNLQGLTFAYGAEAEIVEEKARLIQLDMSAMQAAVQEAAENGVLVTAPEMTASAANAQELPFTDPAYELSPGNIEALLAEGTELPGDTSLRIFLEPLEEPGENDGYIITGDEQLIFLIENESNEALAYQIQFGDKVTGLIVAESRKALRKELNGEAEEEFVGGGAGGSGSAQAPTEESSESVTEPGTEESSQAETEESSEAVTEPATEESSQAETEESSEAVTEPATEESSQAETEESSEAVTEPATEESSQAETEESSEAVTEPATEESSEAVTEPATEESSQAESVPESSAEETTEAESTSGSESAEISTEAVTEASAEETTAESIDAAVEEESDVPEEGQVAPENESPIAALWRTTVNFLTGSITAHAAETATPPEATETEPESESESVPESQTDTDNQGASGSEGGSGSAGGSGAQEDTDIPVATGGNAADGEKANKKPQKEKVFVEADGLDGLTFLDIDAVNVLVDGGLQRADGGMIRMMAAFADVMDGEKSVAMFALPLNALLAPAAAGDSPFQMTLYDYSGTGVDASNINAYLKEQNDPFRFGGGHTDPWNAWNVGPEGDKTKVNIYQGIVSDTIEGDGFPNGTYLKTNLFPGSDVTYEKSTVIKQYPISNPKDIFTHKNNGYYVYDSKQTPVKYSNGQLKLTEEGVYKNTNDPEHIQENLPGGFWPFKRSNFYHGMKFSFNFSLLADGKAENLETGARDDMIFKFAGDDDVWVYLTDLSDESESRLVLDVGGDHNSMTGTINFATGVVQYERTTKEGNAGKGGTVVYGTAGETPKAYLYTYEDWKEDYPKDWWMSDWWLQEKFNEEYPLGSMGLKRKDLAQYRLDFYYLERGGNASNCYLEFNMPVVEKDKVTVAKKVVSDNEQLLNGTYEFELQVSGEEKETIYVPVKNGYGTKSSNEYDLKNANTSFTLKEVAFWAENGEQKPTKTEWLNSAGQVVSENLTAEGTLGEDTLLMCVNYYDNLAPKISKQANLQDSNKPGYYDLVLGVQGATISSTVDGETTYYETKSITAKDTLSEHVAFDLKNGVPQLWLKTAEGQRAEVSVIQDGEDWHVFADSQKIADIVGKEITWYVTAKDNTLGSDETKELHIAIKVTSPYLAEYSDQADQDTGTHSAEKGYYSNVNESAKVTYLTTIPGSTQKELNFPKPVVRPADPSGTLTLKKEVIGVADFADKFDFTITLNGILKDTVSVTYPGRSPEMKTVTDSSLSLNDIQLGDNDSIVITGLNQGVAYTITEKPYTNEFYTSQVVDGNAVKTGTLQGDHASVTVTYTNEVSAKSAMTLKKEVEDLDGILNGTSETYKFKLEKVDGEEINAVTDGFAVYQVNESQKEPVGVASDGSFALTGAGQLLLVFEESFDKIGSYRLCEVDAGTASATSWKTGSGQEENGLGTTTSPFKIGADKEVTFTNTYHNNTLTIEKKLAEDSYKPASDAAKTFKFTVTFKDKNDQPLEKVGYDVDQSEVSAFGEKVEVKNGNITLTNGSVTFDLVAGKQLVLEKIPAGATYTVSEIGWADENLSLAYYENALVNVKHNGSDAGTEKPVNGTFDGTAKDQTVSFTNRIFVNKGTLQIKKQIVDETDTPISLDEKEARTFRFKIEQLTNGQPNGMVIYKTITVTPQSSADGETVVIEVPAGEYQITELETIKYQTVSSNPQSVTVSGGADSMAEVIFQNRKSSDKYFTDVAVAVNVIENTSGENETPQYEYQKQPQALLSSKEKDDDTVE